MNGTNSVQLFLLQKVWGLVVLVCTGRVDRGPGSEFQIHTFVLILFCSAFALQVTSPDLQPCEESWLAGESWWSDMFLPSWWHVVWERVMSNMSDWGKGQCCLILIGAGEKEKVIVVPFVLSNCLAGKPLKNSSSNPQWLDFPAWQTGRGWWWRMERHPLTHSTLRPLLVFHSKVSKIIVFCGYFFFISTLQNFKSITMKLTLKSSFWFEISHGFLFLRLLCNSLHYVMESFLLCPALWPMRYYVSILSLDFFLFSSPRCDSSRDIHPTLHHCHSHTHL